MAQVEIRDFKYGLDRRRPRVVGLPGTLWAGTNVHISRGGDIEAAKKFVATYTLPVGTFGLKQYDGQLYVFGSADLAASVPVGVQYSRLQSTSGAEMVRLLSVNTYGNGFFYSIAEFADGVIYHFFGTSIIAAWTSHAATEASYTTLAKYMAEKLNSDATVDAISYSAAVLVTAVTAGVPFTLTGASVDLGGNNDQTVTITPVVANVSAVAEVRATGTVTITGGTRNPDANTITQITVNAVNLLLGGSVDWVTSHTATAAAVAVQINNGTSTHGYIASAAGAAVTIRAAAGTGVTPNGFIVACTVAGDVTATTANMAGGVAAIAAVAQVTKVEFGGTFQAPDRFTLTLNGTAYVATGSSSAHGTSAFVYKTREYVTQNSLFRWSAIASGSDFSTVGAAAGTGFINTANDTEGTERLVAMAVYQDSVAIFSRKNVRIYSIETDATLNAFRQTLENTGAVAPRSVIAYGNTDVFYLDDTGIRSIQARTVSNQAFVNDAGSPIDALVAEWVATLSPAVVERAVSTIEPTEGRFLMAVGSRIFVLSYFPSTKINAWSIYEPGFSVSDFVRTKRKLYARAGDTVYLYGGASGATYPAAGELTYTVALPFVSAQKPSTFKNWTAIDVACAGNWDVDLLVDPDDETKKLDVGIVTKTTFNQGDISTVGNAPMIAPVLTCTAGGRATISSVVLHFDATETG